MRASSIRTEVSKLKMCTRDVKCWFTENDLLLNVDKSGEMTATPTQLHLAENIGTVTSLTLSTQVKSLWVESLGVIFDPKLTFDNHVSAVYKACNYHIWALRHIRRVLPLDIAKTLASSIVGFRLDYCSSVLYSALNSTTAKLQRVAPKSAKLYHSCFSATPKVVSCLASTGIVTLASNFPSNQLQAGNLGIQNTVNIPTNISSTHPMPVYWLFSVTILLTTSAPGATNSNCIRQPCFQHGCTGHME